VRQSLGFAHLKKILSVEGKPIFTQNHIYYNSTREKWLGKYKKAKLSPPMFHVIGNPDYSEDEEIPIGPTYPTRRGVASEVVEESPLAAALRQLSIAGYTRLTETELRAKLVPTDEFEEELVVMADVRGYFQVAYKRVSDSIPLAIEHQFVRELADGMANNLLKNLRLSGPEARMHCARLLDEDQSVIHRREELEAKVARLEQAQIELLHFTAM